MTEEEAKKCWCPFSRNMVTLENETSGPVAVGSANRFNDQTITAAHCVGSLCMAWRWAHKTPSPANYEGYCGLAGKLFA